MQLFGFTITRTKATPSDLRTVDSRGGWQRIVWEASPGAWQTNVETPLADVFSHPTVFACMSRIAGDVAKMRRQLVQDIGNDVWVPVENPAFSPVLRKPNHYQTAFQFAQSWILSKLQSGNTYVLKQRDGRGVVVAEYVLDPWRVRPLIAPDGSVFYELQSTSDNLALFGTTGVVVPASEIMHDRENTFFHPLVGVSRLYAAGIPAILGLKIETNSTHFFANGQTPGGIVYIPATITEDQAHRYAEQWQEKFSGQNAGRTAFLSEGWKYEPVGMTSSDKAQTTEQWNAAAEAIAAAFGVPWYLVGGPQPPYNNIQALNVGYFTQTIQPLTKAFEDCEDEGLGLLDRINGVRYGVEFNRNDLLLMDTATLMQTLQQGVGSGVMAINEARAQINLPPLAGGETPYLQQQNYPLASLADREPPDTAAPVAATPTDTANEEDDETVEGDVMRAAALPLLPAVNDVRAKLFLPAVASS